MSSTSASISSQMQPQDAAHLSRTGGNRAAARTLRLVLRDAAVILIVLAAAELVLRFVGPEYERNLYDRDFTGSQPLALNDEGYRGPATPLARQGDELRILCLGDSTTFGTGVGAPDAWPFQLADVLRARTPRPVSAMNVAFEGASLRTMQLAYHNQWAAYHPDVVALLTSGNMVSLAWMQRNDAASQPKYFRGPNNESRLDRLQDQANRAFHKLRLPAFLSLNTQRGLYWLGVLNHNVNPDMPAGAMLAHGWRQGGLSDSEAEDAWGVFTRDLRQFRDDVAQHGAVLVVAYSPTRFDVSDSVFDNEKNVPRGRFTIDPNLRFLRICSELQIPRIDALQAVRNERREIEIRDHRLASMYIPFDYAHLDRDGHHALAEAFARSLLEIGVIPSSTSK
ncbi:MAG: SGNH/GDSL hydrolase family protein [Tepidisphaeraceae bacterium]|jgi:lysophospholipase L1-like esterase